jgi:outer membrane protein OmpA-like peptidoglycan-associated protein
MHWICSSLVPLFSLAVTCAALAASADLPGSKDHPLVSRYAGSFIIGYKQEEYGDTDIPLGPAFLDAGRRGFATLDRYEGKRTRILYLAPPERTSLEVMRNYQEALTNVGANSLFQCVREQCGVQFYSAYYADVTSPRKLKGQTSAEYAYGYNVDDERFIAAKISRSSGDVYIMVFTAMQENAAIPDAGKRVATFVEIIETKTMDRNMVKIDAATMEKGLNIEGKIALYGILFDTDKADIKPESKPQLEEMAKLLRSEASLKVYIVGHTDNQGTLEHNIGLSQRRAEAVVRALSLDYGVDSRRLTPKGLANFAPVASNQSEDGRAKNRRVELVEQ